MKTKHISTELVEFLGGRGIPAAQLAREAGVSPVIVSRLCTGVRKDVRSATADALRAAMRRIAALEECHASEA